MASQRHKLLEQGSTAAGEIHAQGAVAPGIAMQVDPTTYNVIQPGPAAPPYVAGQDFKDEDAGVEVPVGEPGGPLSGSSLTGAIPEGIEPPTPPVDPLAPVLTSLNPAASPIQSGDVNVEIAGTGFTNETVLVWNGADDVAVYQSETLMTTVVKTDLSSVVSTCTVQLRNGSAISNTLAFNLTEPAENPTGRTFPLGPFDLIRVEPQEDPEGVWYVINKHETDNFRHGDTVVVEATGNSTVNGEFVIGDDPTIDQHGNEEKILRRGVFLAATIKDKGRVTITAGD